MTDARQTAAKLAAQINEIVSARGSNYGAPEDNFANIANFWNAWLHARHKCLIALDPVDVGIMSSLIKTARLAQTPGHEDSALDGAIYMLLGYGCGVSDREPGMTDFSFEPAEDTSERIDIEADRRVIPYKPVENTNHWYCPPLEPETGRFFVFATKWDGEIMPALYKSSGDWLRWAQSARVVKWRYATTEEIHPDGIPEHLRENNDGPTSPALPPVPNDHLTWVQVIQGPDQRSIPHMDTQVFVQYLDGSVCPKSMRAEYFIWASFRPNPIVRWAKARP